MDIDIRQYIINNFKDDSKEIIKKAIESSIQENDETTLFGMGVFMELLWNACDKNLKEQLLNILEKEIKKKSN